MRSPITADAAARVAVHAVGATNARAKPLKGFAGGESFEVLADSGRFVLKFDDEAAVSAEAWACETATAAGAPAPRVVATGDDKGMPFLVLEWIAGVPADPTGPAVTQAGAALRRVHEVEGRGFGWLYDGRVDHGGPVAEHRSWLEFVLGMADTSELEARGLLEPGTGDRLAAAIGDQGPELEGVTEQRLLHGDLHLRHLLVDEGRLSGMIDWGDAAFGDPLFDFGRFSRCGAGALAVLADGYRLDVTPERAALIDLYRCAWSVHVLNLELDSRGDWFQPHVAAVEGALAELAARQE